MNYCGACGASPLHCTDAVRPLVAGVGPNCARPGCHQKHIIDQEMSRFAINPLIINHLSFIIKNGCSAAVSCARHAEGRAVGAGAQRARSEQRTP